ncbi:MAG: glycosyltransferase 87 family protein [Candidatus Caldarchaeum sp.]|nr:glycosyltransferase 87 family protein [Candidatus Caldarchaeum sp.]MDW8434742.1 glycosyltransferase 87 family protein [Candidatus Caldarchaeum sp.]
MKKPSPTKVAVATALVAWAVSFYIHHPNVEGNIYSDVVSFWWRENSLREGLIPCIQYFFEYPPSACWIVYASRLLGGETLLGYYVAFSWLSLAAFLAVSWSLTRLAGYAGAFFVLMPSMLLYGVYNFDHFFTAFMAAAFVAYLNGKRRTAYLLLGAGFSVKLFTLILLPVFLAQNREKRIIAENIIFFIAGALPSSLPILVLNPGWAPELIVFLASWGLENSWTVWLSNDPFSQSAKLLGYLIAGLLIIRGYVSSHPIPMKGFLVISGFLLGSPIFTPQMAIWLLPFTAAMKPLWPWIPLFESSNAAIILTWFNTDTPTLPWTPPQTMALLRAFALAAMWITVYRAQTPINFRTTAVKQA